MLQPTTLSDMTENEITEKMQELPVDVRARCLLSAVQNIYRQANDLGLVSADEVEATIEMAWRDHKASNTKVSHEAGQKGSDEQ